MKKNLLTILSLALMLIIGISCSNDKKDAKTPAKKAPATEKSLLPTENLPNYRYVDIDTVLTKYNLALDYNDEMMRLQSNMESEAKRHESSIKSFANTMQHKYENGQYTNQSSYEADQKKMQQMQTNAANAMDKLQRSAQEAALNGDKVVQDSIKNFIKVYNEAHHYEAIFLKNATLYIDPALDITDEVVEGLNARYNKKEKK